MNPFDLRGPVFLALYLLAFTVLFLVQIARRQLRKDESSPGLSMEPLSAYEIAYVTGGSAAVIDAAVTTLAGYGLLEVRRLVFPGPSAALPVRVEPPRGAFDQKLEQELLAAVPARGIRLETLRETALPALLGLEKRLVALELVFPSAANRRARWHDLWPFVVLALVGAIKIAVGVARNQPVTFLVVLVALTGVYAARVAKERGLTGLTRRGARRIKALRDEHSALRETAAAAPGQILPHEAGLAYSLFGSAMLGGSLLGFRDEIDSLGSPVDEQLAAEEARLKSSLRRGRADGDPGSSDCGSGDSGGSGCGSSDSGGGGCGSSDSGGGGCGGCSGGGSD